MIGTIIVSVVLAGIVVAIICSMVHAKRSGKKVLSCGGNCSACGCCGSCTHQKQKE